MLSSTTSKAKSDLPTITVDRDLAFERPQTQAAAAYWRGLCGERPMPLRGDLKPSAMRSYLPFVNLVDIDAELGSYTVSLQGAHCQQAFGNLLHRKFSDLFPPDVARRWCYCFDLVRDTLRPVRLTTQVGTQGKLWLQCEVFIAPLGELTDNRAWLRSLFWVFVSWDRD